MTHQTKTQMHPIEIQTLKDRHDYLIGELSEAIFKALCHKVNCHNISLASADELWAFAKALETASDYRRAVEKHEREMKAAGL